MKPNIEEEISKALIASFGSSVSELSELFADKIRYLRWKSAIRTLEKATNYAEPLGGLNSVPPLKFFLPFMENCSLEEQDDQIVDMWANLLVSSSIKFEPGHLLFMRILKEITGEEARLLQQIAVIESGKPVSGILEDAEYAWGMFSAPASPVHKIDIAQKNWDKTVEFILKNLQVPGVLVESLTLVELSPPPQQELEYYYFLNTNTYEFDEISFEILRSQNLIKSTEERYLDIDKKLEIIGSAYSLTALGYSFLLACTEKHTDKPN